MPLKSDYQDLRDRALSLKSTYDLTYRSLVNSKSLLESKTKELQEVKSNKLIQESSIKILNQLIDTMSQDHIKSIIDMLTYALQTIFIDQDYSILLEIKELRNKNTCALYLYDSKTDSKVLLEDTGGGIRAIIGFVLQVFYIMYYDLKKVLFLDESLSAVSKEYLPYLMEFIKTLTDKRGFIFLAVCHDERFFEYADKSYIMENGTLKELN